MMRRGVIVGALAFAVLAAMPMPGAVATHSPGAAPFRDPYRSPAGFAGEQDQVYSVIEQANQNPCGFKLMTEWKVKGIDMWFIDGRETSHIVAFITMTNLETGTSYLQTSDYYRTTTYLADGTQSVVIDGSRAMAFYEGEPGPEGVVGGGGAVYFVTGRQSFVNDPKKDLFLSYEFVGQAIDMCEVLA